VDGFDPAIAYAHFAAGDQAGTNGAKDFFDIVDADSVITKQVAWIWPNILAQGKLIILAGPPGNGKSHISIDTAARISTGGVWPDGGQAPQGRILILSSEDGIEDTMVPRLIAAGADLSRITFVRATIDSTSNRKRRAFSLQSDLVALGDLVKSYGDVVLIIIDPITSYMGDRVDSHQTSQVRAVLDPVSDFADRHNVAVLGISHPPKASQSSALNSVTGSLAFVGVARLVFCAIEDASWPGHSLLLPVKNNLGPKASGLRYRIESAEIDGAGGKLKTSRIAWITTVPVTITADEALAAERERKRGPSKLEQAKAFLRDQLQAGPKLMTEIEAAAKTESFSWRTIETAKAQLKIKSKKPGTDGLWVWELPDELDHLGGEQ
jgi:hypothetical protein